MRVVEKADNNYVNVYGHRGDNNWNTPEDLYKHLDAEFHFDFDPCPPEGNNGLNVVWGTSNFVNPPYDDIESWLKKAVEEQPKQSVFLLPVRTCTHYFHNIILKHAKTIRFIRGRLRFSHQALEKSGICPFPSMIVVF